MGKDRLLSISSVLFTALLLILALSINSAQDEQQPTFLIGVLDAEKGAIADGARLAVREINNAGGVEGADGTTFRLELVIASTAEGNTLNDAIDQLAAEDIIAVLGPQTTEDVLTNLPLLQSLGVPILTPAIGDTIVASDTTNSIFRSRAAERFLGGALADYLVNVVGVGDVTTVQLDRASTASRVGFSVALEELDPAPDEDVLLLENADELSELVAEVAADAPPVVVLYGSPELAADFYVQLRGLDWFGVFAYDQAQAPAFREDIPLDQLSGILSMTTWPIAAQDAVSEVFRDEYATTLGKVPGQIEVASYDAITLIAAAISEPGNLSDNLSNIRSLRGVQGILNPPALQPIRGEITNAVAVIQLNALGGPNLVARYAGSEPFEDVESQTVVEAATEIPTATATPEGVVITIESARQNVRTGPGLEYDVLGQLQEGEQRQVIGATTDFDWVVINYRGQNGWLAAYLLDVFGNRSTVPVIAPPPTPPPPPATATPPPAPIPDVVIVSASPTTITRGVVTDVIVLVRNQGGAAAGPFAIAATFPPNNTYSAANVNGLAAGAEQSVALPISITGATGNYSVAIVADLNNQVDEGADGEANNTAFDFNYRLDQLLFLLNSSTLTVGSSIDLDPSTTPTNDLQYSASGLNTVGTCNGTNNCIGILSPNLTWETAHYDAISSANGISGDFVANNVLQIGTTLGVLTADGRRAVLRVDAINPGISITFTYRVYQQPTS